MTRLPALTVEHGVGCDLSDWRARYAAGEVADSTPYALDTMPHLEVAFAGERPPTPSSARRAAAWVLARTRLDPIALVPGRLPSSDATLVWHEKIAVPLLLTSRRRMLAGMIWLTDEDHGVSDRALGVARRAYRRAAGTFVLSSAQVAPLVSGWGLSAGRVRHVLMGVDTSFWTPPPVPGARAGVLTVGNDRHRDHDAVRAALDLVARDRPGLSWSLLSSLPLASPPGYLREHRTVEQVALRERYRSCSVLLLGLRPNVHVSGVTALLEAMACGTPVVATATPGLEDYIQDGVTGFLVPEGDVRTAARRTELLLADPGLARAMGERARESAVARFDSRRMAADLGTFVTDVLLH